MDLELIRLLARYESCRIVCHAVRSKKDKAMWEMEQVVALEEEMVRIDRWVGVLRKSTK